MGMSSDYRKLNSFTLSCSNPGELYNNAMSILGLSPIDTNSKFSFSSVLLNELSFTLGDSPSDFNSQFLQMGEKLNLLFNIFGESTAFDLPSFYNFNGTKPLNFRVETVLSVYDYINDTDVVSLRDAVRKAYLIPLASLLCMMLPARGNASNPITQFKDSLVRIAKKLMPDIAASVEDFVKSISVTETAQNIKEVAEKTGEWAKSQLTDVSQRLTSSLSLAALFRVPAQYDLAPTSSYDDEVVTFQYGPVKFNHVIIKSATVSMGNICISDNGLNGIPESISVSLDLTTLFRASVDMFKPTFRNLNLL